jgi:hypothetical protein
MMELYNNTVRETNCTIKDIVTKTLTRRMN